LAAGVGPETMAIGETARLAGAALGTVGAGLLFVELFQLPSYVRYEPEFDGYDVDLTPSEAREYTLAGRAGALLLSVGFALLFVGELLG